MSPAQIEFLNSGTVLPEGLPFSEAVRVGGTLYLSGQMGIVPGSMRMAPGGIREQTRQTMENIKTTLQAHGAAMRNLVKCTVMLADISDCRRSTRSTGPSSKTIVTRRAARSVRMRWRWGRGSRSNASPCWTADAPRRQAKASSARR